MNGKAVLCRSQNKFVRPTEEISIDIYMIEVGSKLDF